MSAGANTTITALRAALLGFAVGCVLLRPSGAHAEGLQLDVQRVSAIQLGGQELAGAARPQSSRSGSAHRPELSSDDYVAGLVPAISFPRGSAQLTPSATRILDNLGQSLTSPGLTADRFRIEGHTDTTGGAEANRDLAMRRAKAVVAYLEQNCGIAPDRLDASASLKPLAPTGRGVALGLNRRVRFINLGR